MTDLYAKHYPDPAEAAHERESDLLATIVVETRAAQAAATDAFSAHKTAREIAQAFDRLGAAQANLARLQSLRAALGLT